MKQEFLPEFCLRWIDQLMTVGWWLVIVAAVCGTLYAIVEIYAKYKAVKTPKASGEDGGGAVLTPLKDLIEALTKAPAWFALFVAALGLFWISSSTIPQICRPEAATVELETEKKEDVQDNQGGDNGLNKADPESGG